MHDSDCRLLCMSESDIITYVQYLFIAPEKIWVHTCIHVLSLFAVPIVR